MLSPKLNTTTETDKQRTAFMQSGFIIVSGDQIWGQQKQEVVTTAYQAIEKLAKYGYSLVDLELLQQPGQKLIINDNDPRAAGCRFVYERSEGVATASNIEKKPVTLKLVNGVGTFSKDLENATRHPNMLKVFSNLLSSNEFEQIICQVHFKEPNDGMKFAPHIDFQNRISFDTNWKDVNGKGSYIIAVIAIDDHTKDNGCLYTIPGIDPFVEPPRNKAELQKYVDSFDMTKGVALEMKAGDVLFMHPYNLHWSAPNTGNISRFSLLSGMSSVGATNSDYPGLMCKLKNRKIVLS